MRIELLFLFLILAASFTSAASAVTFDNVSIPDVNYGTFTQYWFNPDNQQFDAFGFGYSLIAPFLSLMGAWFFVILWSAIIYRSYERTGNVVMPVVLSILTSTVWGVIIPSEAEMVWTVMICIGVAAIVGKTMLDR